MASSYTEYFQLNQWAAEDKVLRAEFNEDNRKIDQALRALAGAVPRIVTGTYTGDGTESRLIDLGFAPKAIYVSTQAGNTYASAGSGHYGGLALAGHPVQVNQYMVLEIEGTGIRVHFNRTEYFGIYSNVANTVYYYAALA